MMIHPWVAFLTWKFTSIFILATAFLFCLSDEVAHSLTSVENLQQNPTINNWKFAFCASHSRCLMKWFLFLLTWHMAIQEGSSECELLPQ